MSVEIKIIFKPERTSEDENPKVITYELTLKPEAVHIMELYDEYAKINYNRATTNYRYDLTEGKSSPDKGEK